MTIVAAAALVVVTPATPAFAQERSIWALVINEEPKGDVEILLTADGPWLDPSVLVAAGVLKVPDGRRQAFAPDTICACRSRRSRPKSRSPSTKRRFA